MKDKIIEILKKHFYVFLPNKIRRVLDEAATEIEQLLSEPKASGMSAEKIKQAISDIETFKTTHLDWAEHFEKFPDIEKKYVATGEWDSAIEHRRIIASYDTVLMILNQFASTGREKEEWVSVEDEKPHCWESGEWDGRKSNLILCTNDTGGMYLATCYEGILDGEPFFNWYDLHDYEINTKIVLWKKI